MPDLKNEKVFKAIESARLLVNMNEHLYQLSHIWGNKGGFLAVKELTDKINELIQEYHDSGDMDEAIRCLRELNVPHFHHEFIFEVNINFSRQTTNRNLQYFTRKARYGSFKKKFHYNFLLEQNDIINLIFS